MAKNTFFLNKTPSVNTANVNFSHHYIFIIMRIIVLFFLLIIVGCKSQKDSAGNTVNTKAIKKKTLVAVNMKALRIEAFPKYDKGGEDWDAYAPFATAPDLYVSIAWNNTMFYKSETHNECAYGSPVVLTTGLPAELKPFDQILLLEVFDEDGVSSNDNLGYFNLNLLEYKDWKTVILTSADKTLSVSLELEWVYQ